MSEQQQQQQSSHVHPQIWQTCTGAAIQIPKLHSRVYYFPQGHLEYASSNTSLQGFRPFTICIISAVDLLADPNTDEVFVKLLLTPITKDDSDVCVEDVPNCNEDDMIVSSFTKILTRTDVCNFRSFYIPRFCADNVFLPLHNTSQNLLITDVHGEVWKFCHVCRGSSRRNILYISQWNSFVNKKKLVEGDSVVFMKNSTGKLFVGIRRVEHKNKLDAELEVMEALKLSEENKTFEVVYYPRGNDWCDFVVDGNIVDESIKIQWNRQMRVKIKTDNYSLRIPYQGTISTVSPTANNLWRMLQVNWDEFQVSQISRRVCPWWVELISLKPAPGLSIPPPTKKLRTVQTSADEKGLP